MAGVADRTYLIGVAYFAREMAEIDIFGLPFLKTLADPFKTNLEGATDLMRLSKILSEVSKTAFYGSSNVRLLRIIAVWTDSHSRVWGQYSSRVLRQNML